MTTLRYLGLAIGLACAAAAQAQQYKWVDQDGRVQYGDTPPAGVKATPLRPPPRPATQPAAAAKKDGAKKDAPSRPLTPAEQEREFQKRAKAAREADAKADKSRQEAEAGRQNCENARQTLRNVESGQRISRVGKDGERAFLEDEQIAQEAAQARKSVSEWCK